MMSRMRIGLLNKLKPIGCTESYGIDVAGRLREKDSERSIYRRKMALNAQKSAEAIVAVT